MFPTHFVCVFIDLLVIIQFYMETCMQRDRHVSFNSEQRTKKRGKPSGMSNHSSILKDDYDRTDSRKTIARIENQKKVKQIFYDLQIKDIQGLNVDNLMDDLAERYKKCEELYDQIYVKNRLVDKNIKKAKNSKQKGPMSEHQKWKRGVLQKKQRSEVLSNALDKFIEGQDKIKNQIKVFKQKQLTLLDSLLNKVQNAEQQVTKEGEKNKQNQPLNEEEIICRKMTEIDKIFSNFMFKGIQQAASFNGLSSRVQKQRNLSKDEESKYLQNSRLDQILHANKTTKNTTNIYSEQQLKEISRYNLRRDEEVGKVDRQRK